jgi:hypothetical protein
MICLGHIRVCNVISSDLTTLTRIPSTPFWKSEPIGLVAVKSLCRLEAERAGGHDETVDAH